MLQSKSSSEQIHCLKISIDRPTMNTLIMKEISKFICSQNMFETNVNNLYTHNKFPSESLESENRNLIGFAIRN